jgi:hypothetical protein
VNNITKENIDSLFEKYPPNWWIRIVYKYFSKETNEKDFVLSERLGYILLVLFIVGFLLTAFNAAKFLIMIVTLSYTLILGGLVFFVFVGVFLNRSRLKKIINELNISVNEYNALIRKFY